MRARFPVWLKLFLVALPFMAPAGLFAYFYLSTAWETIAIAVLEKKGVEYVIPAKKIIDHLARHRGLTNGFLEGDASLKTRVEQEEKAVDAAVAELDAVNDRYGTEFKVDGTWAAVRADWARLKERSLRLKPAPAFSEHTQLIKKVFDLYMDAAEASTLPLDPDVETYYVQDSAITRLFYLTENLAQLRGRGTGLLAQKSLSTRDKAVLEGYMRNTAVVREMIGRNLESAFRARPALHRDLDVAYLGLTSSTDNFLEFLNDRVLEADTSAVTAKEFFDVASRPVDACYTFADASMPLLVKLLDERIAKTRFRITATFVGIGASIVVSALVAFLVARGMLRQVRSLNDTFAEIGLGNFGVRARVVTADEIGTVALALNGMLGSLETLLEAPPEPVSGISKLPPMDLPPMDLPPLGLPHHSRTLPDA